MINSFGSYFPDLSVVINSNFEKKEYEDVLPKSKNSETVNKDKSDKLELSKNNSNRNSIDNLSEEDKKVVERLKQIESQVVRHEQAHIAAGGGLVSGGASYNYTTGPDGKRYIVGGEVQIDSAPIPNDPEATILKMQQVRSAALAPSDPSPQDRAVANMASKNEMNARMELSKKQLERYNDDSSNYDQFLVNVFA